MRTGAAAVMLMLVTSDDTHATRDSYDLVAEQYAAAFSGELRHKPLDRALLDCLAEQATGPGPIVDVGCGPGHVARYLADRGATAAGVDLSPGMVAQARRLNPGLPFSAGSMLALDAADGDWAGIAAFYSVIHLTPQQRPRAFAEFHRVLRTGGLVLLAFHVGREVRHLDEWWDREVCLDFHFLDPGEVAGQLEAAGLSIEARVERAPYPDVEHPSNRAYLFARKTPG